MHLYLALDAHAREDLRELPQPQLNFVRALMFDSAHLVLELETCRRVPVFRVSPGPARAERRQDDQRAAQGAEIVSHTLCGKICVSKIRPLRRILLSLKTIYRDRSWDHTLHAACSARRLWRSVLALMSAATAALVVGALLHQGSRCSVSVWKSARIASHPHILRLLGSI